MTFIISTYVKMSSAIKPPLTMDQSNLNPLLFSLVMVRIILEQKLQDKRLITVFFEQKVHFELYYHHNSAA